MLSTTQSTNTNGSKLSTEGLSNTASTGVEKSSESQPLSRAQRLKAIADKRNADASVAATATAPANAETLEQKAAREAREAREKDVAQKAKNQLDALEKARNCASMKPTVPTVPTVPKEEPKNFSNVAKIMEANGKRLVESINDSREKSTLQSHGDFLEDLKEWESKMRALQSAEARFLSSVPEKFREACTLDSVYQSLNKDAKSLDVDINAAANELLLIIREYRVLIIEHMDAIYAHNEVKPEHPANVLHRRVNVFIQNSGLEDLLQPMLSGDDVSSLQCMRKGFDPMILSFLQVAKGGKFFFELNKDSQKVGLNPKWKSIMARPYNKEQDTFGFGKETYEIYVLYSAVYNFLTVVVPTVAHKNNVSYEQVLMNHGYFCRKTASEISQIQGALTNLLLKDAKNKDRKKGPVEVHCPKGPFLAKEIEIFLQGYEQSKLLTHGISDQNAEWMNPTSPMNELSEFMKKNDFLTFQTSIDFLKKYLLVDPKPSKVPSEKNPNRMAYVVRVKLPDSSPAPVPIRASAPVPLTIQQLEENALQERERNHQAANQAEQERREAHQKQKKIFKENEKKADEIALLEATESSLKEKCKLSEESAHQAQETVHNDEHVPTSKPFSSTLKCLFPETMDLIANELGVEKQAVDTIAKQRGIPLSAFVKRDVQEACKKVNGLLTQPKDTLTVLNERLQQRLKASIAAKEASGFKSEQEQQGLEDASAFLKSMREATTPQ